MPRTLRFLAVVLVPLLALVAAGCGGGAGTEVDVQGAPAQERQGVTLPTLPSVAERQPDAYDAQGCARVGPDQVDCSETAAALDQTAASPEDGWRTLAGFVGPHFVTEVGAGTVALIDGTTVTSTSGAWTATGLVRNETTAPATAVVVEAVLVGASGEELETVRGDVAVDPIRPGEPAPFELVAGAAAGDVVEVRWSISFEPAPSGPDGRIVELVTWWDRAADDPEPVDLYLYRDEPGAPLPYLLFGAITNHGTGELTAPAVVAAWIDDQGRAVAVEETDAITDPANVAGGSPLAPGASADFLFVLDGSRPPEVDSARVVLWAVAR